MGTPDFAVPILNKLINSEYKPIAVITEPDKKVGRKQILTPPPVKVLAEKHNIPVLQPEKIRDSKLEIRDLKPDLIIIAAYGQIIPAEILNIPKYGCLNVHPSLLPKYRGSSPIQTAILNGDEKTGVTIMQVTEKMDAGPILANSEIQISKSDTTEELSKKLSKVGAQLLIETLPKYLSGEIKPQPQDDTQATYCQLIKKEDGHINWNKKADEIERMTRAFHPWPGTFTFWNSKLIKIFPPINYQLSTINYRPGIIFLTSDKKLAIACKDGYLIVEKLQLEGKKTTSAKDFLNGHPNFIGSQLT